MPFNLINCVDVVGVYDSRSDEAAEELCQEVDGEASPGELAVEAEVKSYGGVEKAAGVASDIDPEHYS